MKNTKKITRLLTVLVLVVWGTVAYRISESLESEKKEGLVAEPPVTLRLSKENPGTYIYVGNVRDPFHFVRSFPKKEPLTKVLDQKKPEWSAPPFTLNGILKDKKGKTAILEGAIGSTFFLREGDTLSGMKIVEIKEPKVTYVYLGRKAVWSLDESR